MASCFIVSVGTSLFRYVAYQVLSGNVRDVNLNILDFFIEKYQERNKNGRLNAISLSHFIEQNQQEFTNKKNQLIEEIYNYLISSRDLPRLMSAEINSLHAYKEELLKKTHFPDGTCFDLFHTHSFIGHICAEVVKKFLEHDEKNVKVTLTLIKDLTVDATSMSNKGLYNYTRCLFDKINYYTEKQNFDKRDIKIIGTGGFKAQIPYTSLVSIIYSGVEGYYYHQLFKNIISLPKIPILFIDTQAIIKNKQLINQASNQLINKRELLNRWNDEVDENYIDFLFDQEIVNDEQFYKLSTTGKIMLKTIKEVLSSEKKKHKDMKINITELERLSDNFFFKGKMSKITPNHPSFLLITTGVSVFTQAINHYSRNRNELAKNSPIRQIIEAHEDHKNNEQNVLPIGQFALEHVDNWKISSQNPLKDILIKELRDFIEREQIYRTCAELNTLKRMIDENYISTDNVRGCFLVSDTYIGKLCGAVLSQYSNDSYGKGKKHFTVQKIKGLGYNFESFKHEGLPNLIKEVIRLSVHPEIDVRDMRIAICATGGFKAETAYITMLGMILGKPVFYIHENHANLICFPPFPVVLNYSKIIRYFDHLFNLKWGIDGNKYKNYEKIWKDNNDEVNMKLFVKEINKEFKLNDAGEIILGIILKHTDFSEIRKIRENFITERVESKDEKFCLENPHHIDWRSHSTGGAPPEPAGVQGIGPLERFLAPILSRMYVSTVQCRVGGLDDNPLKIVHSNRISMPKYVKNSGGGNVQVKFPNNTLTLTIVFNQLIIEYQKKLEKRLENKAQEILNELFDRNIGHEIQIKLPNNHINNNLINSLIDFVNSNLEKERKVKEEKVETERRNKIPDHCLGCRWINPNGQMCNRDYEANYGFDVEINEETGLGVCHEEGDWVWEPRKVVPRERKLGRKLD